MKTLLFSLSCVLAFVSCQKSLEGDTNATTGFSTPEEFLKKNEAAIQTYSVNSTTGGSFTSAKGTKVTIPAAAFVTLADKTPVSGNVSIQFRDIYKKSDMLLSRMPTTTFTGHLLKSGGEFFIKATLNDVPLQLATGKTIEVEQPIALTGEPDDEQIAFAIPDSATADSAIVMNNIGWIPTEWGGVASNSVNYIFSLYQFSSAPDSGTWCNSDNPTYFSIYPLTTLTLNPTDDPAQYQVDVFLFFKNVSAMVHVYATGNQFSYFFAPAGFECTMVAIGVKDKKLYSSFVPITITQNLSVDFTLSQTTEEEFLTKIKALD